MLHKSINSVSYFKIYQIAILFPSYFRVLHSI